MASLLSSILLSHSLMPTAALKRLVEHALAEFEVYLCLHRVEYSRSSSTNAKQTVIPANELDRLLDILGCGEAGPRGPRVTASFDDGYADAVDYVQTRHSVFPNVNWSFFVCPAKTRDRVGFRWDLEEVQDLHTNTSVERENQRPDLQGLADEGRCRLATVQELRAVSALPRVSLGNHTNCHFALATLDPEDCAREIRESRRDFEELFGATDQFAFPFGVYTTHYGAEHVELLKSAGYRRLLSVESKPAMIRERREAEVIPRFAVMGSWPATKTALYIALVTLREKLGAKALRPTMVSQ